MADTGRGDRAEFDALVSGGTKRQIKKAAKAKYPGEKLKIRVKKADVVKGELLATVPLRDKRGVPKRSKTGRKLYKRVTVVSKGSKPEKRREEEKTSTPQL